MPREMSLVMLAAGLSLVLGGCPKRDVVPESSYDPALIETAREVAEEEKQDEAAAERSQVEADQNKKSECNRDTGGCPEGSLCWDSWYCKQSRPDQCSAQGDKRCHKRCDDDSDCPERMPHCIEKPIFNGSDRGVLEKFCASEQ